MKTFFPSPSRIYCYLLLLLHCCALVLVLAATVLPVYKVLFVLLCLVSYYVAWRRYQQAAMIQQFTVTNGLFTLVDKRGEKYVAELDAGFFSSPFFIALTLKPVSACAKQKRQHLCFFRDALCAEGWRRLRVLLRTMPSKQVGLTNAEQ